MSTTTTQTPDLVSDLLDAGAKEFNRALELQLHQVRGRIRSLEAREEAAGAPYGAHYGEFDAGDRAALINLYQAQATLSLAAAHARTGALTEEFAKQVIESTARESLELAIQVTRKMGGNAIRRVQEAAELNWQGTTKRLVDLSNEIEKELTGLIESRETDRAEDEGEKLIL